MNPEVNRVNIDPNIKRPRRWTWFFLAGCFGCLGVFLIILYVFAWTVGSIVNSVGAVQISEDFIKTGTSKDKIAVIPVNGIILDDVNQENGILSGGVSASRITDLLNIAANDANVKAIILRENTPGGSELAARKICNAITTLRKPVYTYIESQGASGGYYIANCTKYIISDVNAITGSIGAIYQVTDIQGLLDKLGIKVKDITNTSGTQKASDFFQTNSKDETKIKQILDNVYFDFVKQVAKGRADAKTDTGVKVTEEYLKPLATGEIFSGKEAKSLGLVDEIAMFEDSINIVIKREVLSSDIQVVQYNASSGNFLGIPGMMKGIFGTSANNTSVGSGSIFLLYKS